MKQKTNRIITGSTYVHNTCSRERCCYGSRILFKGEETVEKQMEADDLNEEETAEDETESADVTGDNSELAEDDIWTSGEEGTEFGTDEIPEAEEFTSEESDGLTDAAEAAQVKGSFAVAYIQRNSTIMPCRMKNVRKWT